jgi:hypothetical protein
VGQERLDGILAGDYLDGLDDVDTRELRRMRAECEEEEGGLSYARRVLQGRLDILRAELLRREGDGDRQAESLLARLPDILGADHAATDPLQARATRVGVPGLAEEYGREVDAIVDEATLHALPELPAGDLEALIDRLAEHERHLSSLRGQIFDRIDRIRDELAVRYRDGRASIGELLQTDG